MNVVKGVTSLMIAVFSGWVGVFPLMITTWRIMGDVFHSGELRAVPHAAFNGLYGFSWRIAFFIGSLPMWNSTDVFLGTFRLHIVQHKHSSGLQRFVKLQKSIQCLSSPFAELLQTSSDVGVSSGTWFPASPASFSLWAPC